MFPVNTVIHAYPSGHDSRKEYGVMFAYLVLSRLVWSVRGWESTYLDFIDLFLSHHVDQSHSLFLSSSLIRYILY